MGVDKFFNREVGIAVAVTALATSPRVRQAVRQGAIYGLASAMAARDRAQVVARRAAEEAQRLSASAVEAAHSVTDHEED